MKKEESRLGGGLSLSYEERRKKIGGVISPLA
jgi:hypothetical protein